tara:strand:- start:331 stop:516 length:186 start_codon:yes stop_codon:yes gene_type:complete
MKRIAVNDDLYVICGTVLVEKVTISTDELKKQYSLADTVLRNGDTYYICQKISDAEFEDIP